jgi:hypothetical protein
MDCPSNLPSLALGILIHEDRSTTKVASRLSQEKT